MKLLTRTTIYYLLFSLPLLMLSGWFLYYNIEKSLRHELDEELQYSNELWIHHLNSLPPGKDILELNSPFIQIEKTNHFSRNAYFSDTLLTESAEEEKVPYRNLTVFIERNQQYYQLSYQRSVIEQRDVFKNLVGLVSIVFGGLLLFFLLINVYINKRLWKPFNQSLSTITTLNLQQLQQVHFDKASIGEFNALNNSLNAMISKMRVDYESMKTFTQNASHEIQTPLAIIQSKLELLLQDKNLTETQATAISSAFEATERLSRLNQALLLITKIENNQFRATAPVSIQSIVEKYQSFFAELLHQKNIAVSVNKEADWLPLLHPLLADMLVSNLFGNAIRYNIVHGKIMIQITATGLDISNTSTLPAISDTQLYHRFAKQDATSGNGLGLAIVKEICDAGKIVIQYSFNNAVHQFKLTRSL